jgi:hypothetical protein
MFISRRIPSLVIACPLVFLIGCTSASPQIDSTSHSPITQGMMLVSAGTHTDIPKPTRGTESLTATERISPTPTDTVTASDTPTEYPTLWPDGFTPTTRPTPTRGLPPTATLSPRETCPPPTHVAVSVKYLSNPADYEQPLLDFLEAIGNLREYKEQLDMQYESPPGDMSTVVFEEDVTGDGTREFLISINQYYESADVSGVNGSPYRTAIFILGCRGGEYDVLHRVLLEKYEGVTMYRTRLEAVVDINADGIKEIIYSFVANIGRKFTDLSAQVLEWNGREFRELMLDDPGPGSEWNRYAIEAFVEFRDIDGNGTMEVVFPNLVFGYPSGMGIFMECEGGVVRNDYSIWMWDGEYYRYMWTEPVAPLYRFQAALDGDLFSSIGLFDRAETMYLRAVFDSKLKPGSSVDWRRDYDCYVSDEEKPDATEPTRIQAYARFRLVELFTRVGRVMEAESHRSYLRTNYPLGSPGYFYAYLANVFWWEYTKEENISAACAAVRREAEKNQTGVFGLFANYGYSNPGPTLENICPFTSPAE